MKLLICLVVASVVLPGCTDGEVVKGNGKSKTEVREVKTFKHLDAHLNTYFSIPPCKYWVTMVTYVGSPMGDKAGRATDTIKITADENILPLIKMEVVGDQLKLDLVQNVSTDLGIRVDSWSDSASVSSAGCTESMMSIGGERPSLEKSK